MVSSLPLTMTIIAAPMPCARESASSRTEAPYERSLPPSMKSTSLPLLVLATSSWIFALVRCSSYMYLSFECSNPMVMSSGFSWRSRMFVTSAAS